MHWMKIISDIAKYSHKNGRECWFYTLNIKCKPMKNMHPNSMSRREKEKFIFSETLCTMLHIFMQRITQIFIMWSQQWRSEFNNNKNKLNIHISTTYIVFGLFKCIFTYIILTLNGIYKHMKINYSFSRLIFSPMPVWKNNIRYEYFQNFLSRWENFIKWMYYA